MNNIIVISQAAFPKSDVTSNFSACPKLFGDTLSQKSRQRGSRSARDHSQLPSEIQKCCTQWLRDNESLQGPLNQPSQVDSHILRKRTELLKGYLDFADQRLIAEALPPGTRLHSKVLREFIQFLFRDLIAALPSAEGNPRAVAIECKTYLDKTMLEGASTAAEQLKVRSPNSLYIVVSEWLKLTENVNLRKYKVDQIYVLRKQKNTDREFRYLPDYQKNPIHADVVEHLFQTVRSHLTTDWERGVAHGLERGYLL